MRIVLISYVLLLSFFFFSNIANAHSGRTDSSGGHNCNVGSCAGTYHYHNSGSSYTPPTYIQPKPTCGNNAYLNSDSECSCKSSYVSAKNNIDCVYLPPNAHVVSSFTDVWECDFDYEEVGTGCIKKQPAITPEIKVTENVILEKPIKNTSNKSLDSDSNNDSINSILGLGVIGTAWYLYSKYKKN